jgi:hypothetical protein
MADITLAEYNGRVWLVGGEPFIDDLLANTLAPEISIELVPCEHKSEVKRLWVQHCGPQEGFGDPWLIHPAIVDRIRRTTTEYSVFFAEWSAAIDADGHTVIASVGAWWHNNQTMMIDLVEFLDPAGPKSIVDLSRLRAQLVEEALVKAGVPAGQIGRATRLPGAVAGLAQESQRIEIVLRVPELPDTSVPEEG